jgi:hypothetical protein
LQQKKCEKHVPAREGEAREGVACGRDCHQLYGENAGADDEGIEVPERKVAALPGVMEIAQPERARRGQRGDIGRHTGPQHGNCHPSEWYSPDQSGSTGSEQP